MAASRDCSSWMPRDQIRPRSFPSCIASVDPNQCALETLDTKQWPLDTAALNHRVVVDMKKGTKRNFASNRKIGEWSLGNIPAERKAFTMTMNVVDGGAARELARKAVLAHWKLFLVEGAALILLGLLAIIVPSIGSAN